MIHQRGYWLDKPETDTHEFDKSLCDAIISTYKGMSVVDIGCGNGAYTKELIKAGFDCVGYDGSPLTFELTGGLCKILDFSEPVDIGKFDLVLSLEVGEHIPAEYEQVFLDNICNACKKFVILSWAIEGQPGIGHFNCRNNDYIIDQMLKRCFLYMFPMSKYLRNESTLSWFANTLMVFKRW